eukprot:gene3516-3852_t
MVDKKAKFNWHFDRLLWLRILVTLCLMTAAAVVGYLTYFYLQSSQEDLESSQYDAIVKKFHSTTLKGMYDKHDALINIASTAAFMLANASQWPYTALPFDYFSTMSYPLMQMAQVRSIALAPIVTPNQVTQFEDFAYDWLNKSGHSNLGLSWFGKGVFSVNQSTGIRYHDTTGSQLGRYRILTPIIEAGNLTKNSAVIMFNLYSEVNRIGAMDYSISCAENVNTTADSLERCLAISGVVVLVQDRPTFRPSSLVTLPVRLSDNATVAIAYTAHNWDTVFSYAVNERVTGLYVILTHVTSEGEEQYTFMLRNGRVSFVSKGDVHDRKFDGRRYSYLLTPMSSYNAYYVHIYPSDEWVDVYVNDLPALVCGVVVGIIVFTALIFLLYDFFMNRAAREQELVLETKRQFVRYISHEIRTPLNIVQLGFKLLYSEMFALNAALLSSPAARTSSQSTPRDKEEQGEDKEKIEEEKQKEGAESNDDHCCTVDRDISTSTDCDRNSIKNYKPPQRLLTALQDWLNLVTDITDSADVAISVLNDLINYDKLHMGTLQLELEPLVIWDLLGPAVQPFFIQARHASVKLLVDWGEKSEGLIVFGDAPKLGQVVRNLVSNALKFTPSGGEVRVKAVLKSDGMPNVQQLNGAETTNYVRHGTIVLNVTDTGAGLSPENLRNLFQEGKQFQANKLQAGQGSGLGLWIAKGIVELHSGTLSAFSEGEDFGSTFTLELPLFRRHIAANNEDDIERQETVDIYDPGRPLSPGSHASPPSTRAQTICAGELGKTIAKAKEVRRILVTDDSLLNRKMVCRLLRSAGYICFEAGDGQECVDMVLKAKEGHHEAIDAIFMDYEMPRMNGPKACEVLRSLQCTIPIIGVTGNLLSEDRDCFLQSGALRVLNKPFTLAQLGDSLLDLPDR